MALFPQLGPAYYDERDKSILSRMESFYSESITINQSFWGEADIDNRFCNNDQTLWNDLYANLPANRRRQFQFNRIRRIVNMVTGHQRRTRKSTIVVPQENADELTADQFTRILMWIHNQDNTLETISDAFEGSLISGMNLLQVWVDYRNDPISGNIKVDNCSYNSFLIDPFFRKADLSDCNAIWKRSYLTKKEIIALLPDKAEEIAGIWAQDNKDQKFHFMPETYNYGRTNLVSYDEYYYKDYRTQKMLIDTESGESVEWKGKDEDLRDFLSFYPSITVIDQDIPTTRLAIVVHGKVMYHDINPLGDSYPFVPVFCYYAPEMPYWPNRVYGIVRGLRDAQYLYNRRMVTILDILESQINSGFKYKENALVNPADVFLSGQGRGLALKEEAQMTDVEQIQSPNIPPQTIQIAEMLGKEPEVLSGINEELLGSAVDDKAGVLALLRQGAGLTTLQKIFDQLDRSQRLLGKLMIEIIQNNFTPGKVKRILNEDPSKQFYDKTFGKYDCTVEDGLNTQTQKQMQFAQYLQLREAGVSIPDDLMIEAATIQNKKELLEHIRQTQQAQAQQAQQASQIQMEQIQAQTRLTHANANATEGIGVERMSKVAENQANARKDNDMAILNLIKAAKELEGIDLDHLEKIITLSQMTNPSENNLGVENGKSNIGNKKL